MRDNKTKLREEDSKPNPDMDRIVVCHIMKKDNRNDKIATRSAKVIEESEEKYIDA
jgi:hypothetical protein